MLGAASSWRSGAFPAPVRSLPTSCSAVPLGRCACRKMKLTSSPIPLLWPPGNFGFGCLRYRVGLRRQWAQREQATIERVRTADQKPVETECLQCGTHRARCLSIFEQEAQSVPASSVLNPPQRAPVTACHLPNDWPSPQTRWEIAVSADTVETTTLHCGDIACAIWNEVPP